MNKIDPSNMSLIIKLESEDYAPEDSEWQEECHKFYLQLKDALDTGTVEPLKIEKKEKGYRSLINIFDYSTLKIIIMNVVNDPKLVLESSMVIAHLYILRHAVDNWIAHRKGTKVTLKFSDQNYLDYIPLRENNRLCYDECPYKQCRPGACPLRS